MALKVTRVEVWAGDLEDQPGGLSRVLGALADAGADVECVIARRKDDRPGTGTVFVSPIRGGSAQEGARRAGLSLAENVATLRVEGADRPGLGGRITRAIGDAGINMRGLTAAVLGDRFVAYLGFDSSAGADRAAEAIRGVSDAGGGSPGSRGSAGRRSGGGGRRSTKKGTKKSAKKSAKKTTKKRARARR